MGKMLLLSFENSEDDVISEILSILENKQMKICENRNIKKCLEFQGLTINAEKRLAVKGNKEIEFTFTEFERGCGHFFRPLCLYSFYNLKG